MEIDDAKENIQPLAQGRNASLLHASLKAESPQELLAQRKELEIEIHNYKGDDPLSVWYNYIEWIEQCCPSGGKESGLQEVLSKCLAKFESVEKYKQDRRMIKLFIKFIDSHKDPAECYQQLYSAGIGTMVADFYIAWAYCYDLIGNICKADEIFRLGISCRAQPLEELQEAHQHFGFVVGQRLINKDNELIKEETNRQLQERRMALTSLRGHRRKKLVGSIRTGSAVKSILPGTIELPSTSSQRCNTQVQVFKDENVCPNVITTPSNEPTLSSEVGKSVVRSIIDAVRDQENDKEPGPWNKAHNRKKGKLFAKSKTTNELGFEIHVDDNDDVSENTKQPCVPPIPIADSEIKYDKPFIYLGKFSASSKPIKGWITPVTTEEMPEKNSLPEYNKCKLYPRPNMEFQPEELKAYNILKKRGIENEFTKERDQYWSCGPKYNIRLYPHFATQSKPQEIDLLDQPFIPEKIPGLLIAFDEIYNVEDKTERQFEEITALRIKRNETIVKTTDMDETMCVTSEKIQRRKSFYPMRKSLAPTTFKDLNRMSPMPEQNNEEENFTINESSNPSVCSVVAKVVDDEIKTQLVKVNQNNNQSGGREILRKEDTCSKEIPVTSDFQCTEEGSRKLLVQNQYDNKLLSCDATEKVAAEAAVSTKSSDIFKDDVEETKCVKSPSLAAKSTALDKNDFQFKTPALPIANSVTLDPVPKKMPFEIFVDENLVQKSPNPLPNLDLSCGGGFFDAEETCSTQTFNIFLKAQSVSTPKAITKNQPQSQFGNILKEVTQLVLPEQKEDQPLPSPFNNPNCAPVATYSPPRQQLSTILETSEHGTTQGTGATTKSTLSSPEFDIDSQVQTTTNAATNQPQTVLETVKERSHEVSVNVDKMMNSMKILNVTDSNTLKIQASEKNTETPCAVRLQTKYTSGGLDFSIFEDSIKKDQKQVGNFSRLEENEETGTCSVFKTLPPIRFQDDKTETVSKILLTSQQIKYQDDKTETISKTMFEPPAIPQFQEDKTETISKILLGPPQPVKFPEDKTETISKFLLAPEPANFQEEKPELILTNKEKNQHENMDQDDSFEFFGQTPPKSSKQFVTTHIRTVADNPTPLTFNSKRFCDKDTPEIQRTKSLSKPTVLFEDKLQPHMKNKHQQNILKDSFLLDFSMVDKSQPVLAQSKIKPQSKSVFRDSFIPDFSVIEDSQPQTGQKQSVNKYKATTESILPASKSVFRDSFIPDFSVIEDSQPQTEQKQSVNKHKATTESTLPEFSFFKNTQIKSNNPPQTNSQNVSLSDFFHVSERQPNESIIKASQPLQPRHLKYSSTQSSVQSNFSKTGIEESTVGANINKKQTAVSNRTQDGTNLKNILMDTFMKDFSEIKEPPPIPNNIKDVILSQSTKSNSSLRFLNESLKEKTEYSKNNQQNNSIIANMSTSKGTKLNFFSPELQAEKSLSKEQKSSVGLNVDKYFELNCETEMFGTNISMIKNSTWLPNHGPLVSENGKQLSQIQEMSLHIKSEEDEVSANSVTSCSTSKTQQVSRPEDATKSKQNFGDKKSRNDYSIEISASELAAINAKSFYHPTDKSTVISESLEENNDDCEMSIYYKQTPKTPKIQVHIWDDADACKTPTQNHYIHAKPDLDQTQNIIENICIDPNVNPFNTDLINAFLEQHYFISYLEGLPTCKLVGSVQRLVHNATININGITFDVIKLIGEGAYGSVFCGKERGTSKLVAMKQEKPPNFWEYYICLELQERIRSDDMLRAYMSVDYALIGNNSSILISNFYQYGSIIAVCNKIKKHTLKNVDEYVVMLLATELLEIMDHLHAVNIIHADIKADNFVFLQINLSTHRASSASDRFWCFNRYETV